MSIMDGTWVDQLEFDLKMDEGLRLFPYEDTVGKLTIGYGRNLDDVGISRVEALQMLSNDIAKTLSGLHSHIPWFGKLSPNRKRVLANMAFNLGLDGLLKFTATLKLIKYGLYLEASLAMLESKWAKQVGPRAQRLAQLMKDG